MTEEINGLDKPNIMQRFGQLSPGIQRVIIAVVLILVLVGLMLLRDMIKTEESVDDLTGSVVDTAVSGNGAAA